jgi:hypothetical protein
MSIEESAARALEERIAAMNAYAGIPDLRALEELRFKTTDPSSQRALDLVILARRREAKVLLESFDRLAELYDKSALPSAAALPAFVTFLVGEHVVSDPWRTSFLAVAYLFGGLVWIYCRFKAHAWGRKAKLGAAELGKVD